MSRQLSKIKISSNRFNSIISSIEFKKPVISNNSAWSPLSLSGLLLWWDLTDISTLWQDTSRTSAVTSGGQNIRGVTDKSGNGNHGAQSGPTRAPVYVASGTLNSKSCGSFDGSDDYLGCSLNGANVHSICVIYRLRSVLGSSAFGYMISMLNGSGEHSSILLMNLAGYLPTSFGLHYTSSITASGFAAGNDSDGHALILTHSGATYIAIRDGVSQTISNSSTFGTFSSPAVSFAFSGRADASFFLSLELYELFVTDTHWGASDRNLVAAYTLSKYGV